MDGLKKVSIILISAILLLLPGAFGLDYSMGTSNGINGASESIKLNAPLESSLISSTEASPVSHVTSTTFKGNGPYKFEKTFSSLSKGEHVRLIAGMKDSKSFVHSCDIETRKWDRIRVSQSLDVDQGRMIECSTEAWNSFGQSAKVGLKMDSGSLDGYRSYGDASSDSVVADQEATIPAGSRFSVFSEAKQGIFAMRSMGLMSSSAALDIKTTTAAAKKRFMILNMASKSKDKVKDQDKERNLDKDKDNKDDREKM